VIINHNTKQVTFLALLSVLRFASVPVLVIDCASKDGSFNFFSQQMNKCNFDLMKLPFKKHGTTLDRIFTESKDEQILLVDSDLEILSTEIIDFFNRYIDEPRVFGCGFLNGPGYLKHPDFQGTVYDNALYFERPFMPIVLLKTNIVKEALQAGYSFTAEMVENDWSQLPGRMVPPVKRIMKLMKIRSPQFLRKRFFTHHPERVFYDTGARIYEYLRFKRFLFFANLPEPCHQTYVQHYWGATRSAINPNQKHTGDLLNDLGSIVQDRLKTLYNESV